MTKVKVRTEKTISLQEWNRVVQEVYGKPYHFQQQDGCKSRGREYITASLKLDPESDFKNESVPEKLGCGKMGVSFAAWLARDPKTPLKGEGENDNSVIELWWHRNFYPYVDMIAHDLCKKGILKPGTYSVIIDW